MWRTVASSTFYSAFNGHDISAFPFKIAHVFDVLAIPAHALGAVFIGPNNFNVCTHVIHSFLSYQSQFRD